MRGIADLQDKLGRLEDARPRPRDYEDQRARLQTFIGALFMYEGRFGESSSWFERAVAENRALPLELRANIGALRGIAALRRGEIENCVACLGSSSCIFPLSSEAVHQRTEGSREAIRYFLEYLHDRPADLGVRWLLNIAYMTLGEYPQEVPATHPIPPDAYQSRVDMGRFENVAARVGLGCAGPNLLGGSVFDDFTGDGSPDILVFPATGTKVARCSSTREMADSRIGARQPGWTTRCCRSTAAADFDNDGNLDVLGAPRWFGRLLFVSLCCGTKEAESSDDVTVAAGLGQPIAASPPPGAIIYNDGLLDVYVAGWSTTSARSPARSTIAGCTTTLAMGPLRTLPTRPG